VDRVRWESLFADLQAQWEAELRADDDAEIRELAEAEAAGTRLGDRLRARRGEPLTLRLVDGSDRSGVVGDVAQEWLLLAEGERRHLVPVAAIALAWPLAGAAPAPSRVERGLGLGHVLSPARVSTWWCAPAAVITPGWWCGSVPTTSISRRRWESSPSPGRRC
jgi:hypothetical protein